VRFRLYLKDVRIKRFFLMSVLMIMLLLAACKPNSNIPNPASVHCEENGGTLKIETDASGEQTSLCLFEGGGACEEWAFYRGDCQVGGIYPVEEYAEDGCKVYRNEVLVYSFHFPADATITSVGNPNKTITVAGLREGDESWPMIYFNDLFFEHPEFSPPEDVNLMDWLEENNLLAGEREPDTSIASEIAIHLRQNSGVQSYPLDHFFFNHDG
jgi:putative hemolysin